MTVNEAIIDCYSRAQAIEDGFLVDVSQTAKEAGFKFPVSVTKAVWIGVITPDEIAKKKGQSKAGRLWDVLWMCYLAARRGGSGSEINFRLYVVRGSKEELINLKGVCHPGDNLEPVITIMLPDED